MDFVRIGHFFCKEQSDLLKKKNLKQLIDFQKHFPNAIILFFDYNLSKTDSYAFECFRIHKNLMELVDLIDIEEDEPDIFKKFVSSDDILQRINFTISEDVYSLFTSLSETKHEKTPSNQEGFKRNLYMKVNELNKTCDKYIEEQKKYINYYKVKKTFGKTKESEFLEQLSKKGNELAKLEKIDISILSKNIHNLNEKIKTVTEGINVKNTFQLDLA
jgi:hypothetical protein